MGKMTKPRRLARCIDRSASHVDLVTAALPEGRAPKIL